MLANVSSMLPAHLEDIQRELRIIQAPIAFAVSRRKVPELVSEHPSCAFEASPSAVACISARLGLGDVGAVCAARRVHRFLASATSVQFVRHGVFTCFPDLCYPISAQLDLVSSACRAYCTDAAEAEPSCGRGHLVHLRGFRFEAVEEPVLDVQQRVAAQVDKVLDVHVVRRDV